MSKLIKYEIPYGDNAMGIMGGFRRAASSQGMAKVTISRILSECMKGDYDHLCETIENECE